MHPLALQELHRLRIPADGLRSKSWAEFAQPGAPQMDFVMPALPLERLDRLAMQKEVRDIGTK